MSTQEDGCHGAKFHQVLDFMEENFHFVQALNGDFHVRPMRFLLSDCTNFSFSTHVPPVQTVLVLRMSRFSMFRMQRAAYGGICFIHKT